MFRGSGKSQPRSFGSSTDSTKSLQQRKLDSSTVFIIANNAEEFEIERTTLWQEVLPELQVHAFQMGFDLEFCDVPMERGELSMITVEQVMKQWNDNTCNFIVCLLGNRYGTVTVPTTLKKLEFEAIRETLFQGKDGASTSQVLTKAYTINRNNNDEYQLNLDVLKDKEQVAQLKKVLQKGAKAAHTEGTINQVHETQQQRFFSSPLDIFVNRAIQSTPPCRCLFLLRKFEGATAENAANSAFVEKKEENIRKIEDLKNEVSMKMTNRVMTHVLRPENNDINYFFNSSLSDRYRETISRQFSDKLKTHLSDLHKTIRPDAPASATEMAATENSHHTDYLKHQLAIGNLPRTCYDKRLDEMANVKVSQGVYLLQGPDVSGKTQALCRLYDKISDKDAFKIIRFTNLTYSSNFAHEVWRNICLTICSMTNIDPTKVLEQFKLVKILECLENLMKNLDKPICIFLDDVHLLKCGHFLSQVGKRTQTAPDKLCLFMTSSNVSPVMSMYTITQTLNIEVVSENEVIEMLNRFAEKSERKMTSEQASAIRSAMITQKENILISKSYVHEILHTGNSPMKGGIDGRIERIEQSLGKSAVSTVCKYISMSSHGLTRLELHDVMTSQKDLLSELNAQSTFPMLLLDNIIEALGPMVRKVFIDNRELICFAHTSICFLIRQKYHGSVADLKATHIQLSGLFAEILGEPIESSPRHSISYHNFPQGLKRENGSANIRKLRLLWFHLLHSGNLDRLKDLALCKFDYIDLTVRYFGVTHLLSLYEECASQVLHHDLQVLCEQVLLPALTTIVRDSEQLAAEVIGRLRYTRALNSWFLDSMVEDAMGWVDRYNRQPLLVPLTCWIPPPTMKTCRSFMLKDWKPGQTVLAPTPNHQHVLVSGNLSTPGVIYMYHVASEILIATFKGHTQAVTCLCTSHDTDFFVSTSADTTVKIWTFAGAGEAVMTLTHHKAKVTCAILTSDDQLLVTASADSSAKIIKVATGEVIRSFDEHTGVVVALQLTSDNQFLITGSGDFVVQMWDISNGKIVTRMAGLMAPCSALAVTSNNAFIVVACEDETLKVFAAIGGQELHELMGHEGKVNSLVVCAEDDCQLFAATKSKIFCYDIHNGQMIDVLDLQQPYPIVSLRISTDNKFLLSACGPKVTVWNVQSRNPDAHDITVEKDGYLTAIAMSNDEKYAAGGTYTGAVGLWDLDGCQCLTTVVQAKGIPVSCISFTSDSKFILSGNAIGNILIIDASNGNVVRDVNMHLCEIVNIHSVYLTKVLSCDREGKLVMWEIAGEDDTPEMFSTGFKSPIIVPSVGNVMISHCPSNPKSMLIWSLPEEGIPVVKNKMTVNEDIVCFGTAPRCATIMAIGAKDNTIKIFKADNGFLMQVLVGHDAPVSCCCISEDEKIVISGDRSKKMIIWDVSSAVILCTVIATAPISSVSMTGDATVAFTTTEEGWVEAWSTEKGRKLSMFNAHRPIRNFICSFESNRLLLHLTGCAQLPILCLHNTPATAPDAVRRRSARAASVTDPTNEPGISGIAAAVSTGDMKPDQPSSSSTTSGKPGNGTNGQRPTAPKPTFDKLERSKSRTSLIEKDRPTTLTTVIQPTQKSNMCVLL